MQFEFKDYIDVLKENLDNYGGEYEKVIDYSPLLFDLLTDILNEKIISPKERLHISAALGYFVAPFDVIPEKIHGPNGYIDDLYILTHVLLSIAFEHGFDFMDSLWNHEENLETVLMICNERAQEILGEKTNLILSYVGME